MRREGDRELRIRLLGELVAEGDGRVSRAQSGRVAALLALLALEPGRVVSAERLMAQLWGDDAPQSALSTLYVYVSRLRRQLEPLGIRLVTRPPGYALDIAPDEVDVVPFARAIARADAALQEGQPGEAQTWLDVAGELWRGEPFQNAAESADLRLEAQRLTRLRDRLVEIEARCLLDQGLARRAAELSRTLTDREPLNEAFWLLRMESEHALGNTAVALAVYEEFRGVLADALGIDPGRRIRELHTRLLRADSAGPDSPEPDSRAPGPRESGSPVGRHTDGTSRLTLAPPPPEDEVIGREAHLSAVTDAVNAARSGRGTVLVLEGPAGVGKTFLAERAARLAEQQGFAVAWTRAVEATGAPPLWLWQRVLGQLPGARDPSGADDLARLRSLVADAASGVEDATFRLADALVGRVLEASRTEPLLIVIDDVQWADSPTLRAVSLLASSVRSSGCVVVLTVRHPESHRLPFAGILATLSRETSTRRIAVPEFTLDEVRRRLARPHEDRGGETDRMAAQLWERTGGNAFFLTELLTAGPGAELPSTVTELIALRVGELDADARDLLLTAAVDALAVDHRVHAADDGPRPPEVLRVLDELCDLGILRRGADGFAFVHSLARDAVLAALAPHEAAGRHAKLAAAIERVYGADLEPQRERLAYHRYRAAAGVADEAAYVACMAAADRARAAFAFDQAALFRSRALEALPIDDDEPRRRAHALMLLTEERRSAGDVQGASLSLRQALRAAHRLGEHGERDLAVRVLSLLGGVTLWNWRQFGEVDAETVRLLESIVGSSTRDGATANLPLAQALAPTQALTPAQVVELSSALAMELYYGDAAQREHAKALTADAVTLAEQVGDPDLRARAYSARVFALWRPGDDASRREAVAAWLREEGPGDAVALLHRASLAMAAADVVTWSSDADRLAELIPRLGRAEHVAQHTAQLAAMAMQSGRFPEARELIERTYATLRRTSIWGGEWGRWIQLLTLARLEGDVETVADDIVAIASQDAHRALRWSAVIALVESSRLDEARAMQARWNLRGVPRTAHWGTEFDVCQAAEVAVALGTPLLSDAYTALARLSSPLIVAGTGLAVVGSRDELLARLAARLGRADEARRHREDAAAVTGAVEFALGVEPRWPVAPRTARVKGR
ncbi:BTAD domain-containing putative transcriptional regulator [Microbacterium sp.]|uniref:BTAD domain-containing putative transcriptional regulator n=1 Tax=Microbacterium sp. TaxID=51671 RepID=UPI003C742C5C